MSESDRPSMRIGIGSYAFAWAIGVPGRLPDRPMSALGLLEKAVELGVGVVQICDNLPIHAMSDGEVSELCHAAEQAGVAVELGTRGIAPDHLRRYIELCAAFRSPILRTVIDTADHRPSIYEAIALLAPMAKELEQAGARLAIENHDRFAARQFEDIVVRLDSPHIGICLDTVNSFGALEGPETIVSVLAPYVMSLHVKDFSIRRIDHQMGFVIEGCPAGTGRLDVPWLLDQLKASKSTYNAILEQWPAPEQTIEETVVKEAKWAEASIKYLRSLITD